MKKLLFLFIALSAATMAIAQPPAFTRGGNQGPSTVGTISGQILDANTETPVEFATIVVRNVETQKQVSGGITDEDGKFKLIGIPTGKYNIELSFIGYEVKTIEGVELTPKTPDFDLGNIQLASETIALGEVEIVAEEMTFENKIDKLVYNADKDGTIAGMDGTEVLSRVPLLAVDGDGNISLRGSSNIQFLVNGRPSPIFNSNPADALRSFPAEQIKSVEVITVPTARYDGEGTAGIINIITKKKSLEGFTGNLRTSVGNVSNSGNLNLNYSRGRFGMNLNGGGWFGWPRESRGSFYREDYLNDQTRILSQESTGEGNFYGPRGTLSAFYDFNAYNSISTSMTIRGFGRTSEDETIATFTDPINNINQEYTRASEGSSLRGGFDWTTDYRHTFKKPEQEFILAYQISGDQSTTENIFRQEGNDPILFQDERNENDGLNLESTLQMDYIHPFSKAVKFETGAKAIWRTIESDFIYRIFDQDTEDYATDLSRTDNFDYKQDVYAGYASFNFQLSEKYGLITGVRYEHTEIGGDFDNLDFTFEQQYDNWLPSIIISRKINQFSALRLSYTKRIQRPSLFYINPYIALSDPRDITQGNPDLLPENTDQYELNYNTYIKGIVLNASGFYRQTNDVIEQILEVNEEGVSRTTFQNLGQNRSYGVNFFTSGTIAKVLTLRFGANVLNYESEGFVGGRQLSNSGIEWGGNINASLKLPKEWLFEASGFHRSPRQSLQGTRASYRRISFSVRKQFWEKRASIGAVIAQPFNRFLVFDNELSGPTFLQQSSRADESRSFGISFNYQFGKLNFDQRRNRRSRISNDDLKGGGGGEESNY